MANPIEAQQLRHSSDEEPGIRRRGRRRFTYRTADGREVARPAELERIAALAIPPAWTDVWICADASGHVQATGRDAKGRKQYRYHPAYRAQREQEKFADLIAFGEALGPLRRRIDRDLRARTPSSDVVMSLVLALLDRTAIRVGNESYAKDNKTFGLTTMRSRHVEIDGSTIEFCFVGKSGKRQEVRLRDRRLAGHVRRCQQLPGQLLFQWEDEEGELRPVRSDDVNTRLRELTGVDATAKSFRTWHASTGAASLLADQPLPEGQRAVNSAVVEVCEEVATALGNTRSVARASYVHPAVTAAFEEGLLHRWWDAGPDRPAGGLEVEERKLLTVLKRAKRRGLGVPAAGRPGAT